MTKGKLIHPPIERLVPNPYQPRRHFDPEGLDDLAASFRGPGIIQPIVGRPHPTRGDYYQIAAGERRWRAAGLAQLAAVPFIVREMTDQEMAEAAIIENNKRQDLNPIDEALAYQRLKDEFGYTGRQIATLGPESDRKSESHVSHTLRLLRLEPRVQEYLVQGVLDRGHGKVLLALSGHMQVEMAARAVAQQWNVRQLERAVQATTGGGRRPRPSTDYSADPNIRQLEQEYSERLGSPLRLASKKDKWTISIECASLDELDGVLQRIK